MTECSTSQDKLLGSDVRLFRSTPAWALAQAIKAEDTSEIRRLLISDISLINFKEPKYGQSLLEWAVFCNYYNSTKVLAEMGADPNLQSNDGTSPFILAANKFETSDYLRLLLKYGGDVNAVAQSQEQRLRTPLMAAAGTRLESVKLLVDAGADINFLYPKYQCALKSAAAFGKIDIVKYLIIEKNVDFSYTLGETIDNEYYYITDMMRNMAFPLDSEDYKIKMEVVEYLKEKGMNYWETKVPKHFYDIYDSTYLEMY